MVSLSYTISADLQDTLARIDHLRAQILTTPLSPKAELRLNWEATFARLYGSLALAELPLTKSQVTKAITTASGGHHDILPYKKALDAIRTQWTANPKPVTLNTIETFTHMLALSASPEYLTRTLRDAEPVVRQLFDYLQAKTGIDSMGSEHPVIQSAIAHVQLFNINFFPADQGRIARIISNVFLAKYGYDIRGFVALEKHWQQSPGVYKLTIEAVTTHENLTPWLEYFATTMIANQEEILRDITGARTHSEVSASFWELNDRQKAILTALEDPGAVMTNKKAQKHGVSQITASRDLAKLVSLGLLFPHGKGRATYYTRI